ncbi:hypothetical protein [Streptomyces sp. NPDC047123]|uniref:hypothetical protein n=1 Tax=Streptomyces sp. NPDC047123 TaxID=3155622 RepID=UPI0034070F85
MASSGRPTVRERVAERWAEAESAVTKALLLGVFALGLVAQFVRPVGDALEGKTYLGGAILSLIGFVLYSEVRGLNDVLRPEARAEVETADLRTYFDRALARRKDRRTRIDAMGFTGETVLYQISRSTRWRTRAGAAGREKVAQRQVLFETLWRVASPLPDGRGGSGPAS